MKTYSYVDGIFQSETEIKRSRFIATIAGELCGDEAEAFVQSVKRKYPDATHNCYAYIGGISGTATRFSDDGEPSGTAGQPMLEVLRKRALFATAVVVSRYFGGIKLGSGGLVSAYAGVVSEAIDKARVSVKTECAGLCITADYAAFAPVENYLRKNGVYIEETNYAERVAAKIFAPEEQSAAITEAVLSLTNGAAQINQIAGAYVKLN